MPKPIHITGLTQEQRNTCVAASIKSDHKNLDEWASAVLYEVAQRQLNPQPAYGEWDDYKPSPQDSFVIPTWCAGMSVRLAYCLIKNANYTNRAQLVDDFVNQPASHFTNILNFGPKQLVELGAWLNN